ncbi:MAG: sugar ABC transporter substrate-binding protein [Spirochaetales bacterium]|nr:sugar ABC transporter substrate-binding protein [Spirochaetales bacterium]
MLKKSHYARIEKIILVLIVLFLVTLQDLYSSPMNLTFTIWTGNRDQIALLQSFIDEFNAKSGAEVTVDFQTIPFSEYTTKLVLQLQGVNPPDLGWILETTAPGFIDAHTLVDLTDALKDYDPGDFIAPAMQLWQREGRTYAIPFSTSPFFVFYNRDLFRKAGIPAPDALLEKDTWTWAAFRESALKVKKATGVYGFQGTDGQMYDARIWHTLVPVIRSYGGDVWKGKSVLIDAEPSVKAITLIHEMLTVDHSIVPPGSLSDFFTGAAAMTFGQLSRVSKLASVDWVWGIVPMPKGPAGYCPVIGQAAIGAFSRGKHKEVAAKLVAYMTSSHCVARMAGIWPPARLSVLNDKAFFNSNAFLSADIMKTTVAESIRKGCIMPAHSLFPQIELETRPLFDRLWRPDADVKALLKQIAQIMRKYIK